MQAAEIDNLRRLARVWYFPLAARVNAPLPSAIYVGEHSNAEPNCQFPERFLQALWNEQRLRTPLNRRDGTPFEVLSPGTWNVSAGPDFRDAVLKIAGETVRGDIEIHRLSTDWHAHGHDLDPAYGNVILHVVWRHAETSREPAPPPEFDLAGHLDAGLDALAREIEPEDYPYARKVGSGRCASQLAQLSDGHLADLFRAAGLARLAAKSEQMLRRIMADGGDQALYEGVLTALGYRQNKEAFAQLARQAPISLLRHFDSDACRTACLWGMSGLLPDPTSTPVAPSLGQEAMALWQQWWPLGVGRAELSWRRGGSRPLNSPERRLAAGSHWLRNCHFQPQSHILAIAERSADGDTLGKSLSADLDIRSDWEKYISFRHPLPKPAKLLGANRRLDIVINIFIPFVHAIGTRKSDPHLIRLAEEAWLKAPAMQTNRRLTEAVHRFIYPPSRCRTVVRRAGEQQGVLEMYRTLCTECGGDCHACTLTDILPATG